VYLSARKGDDAFKNKKAIKKFFFCLVYLAARKGDNAVARLDVGKRAVERRVQALLRLY
jgi:hypothetical protein